MGRLGEPFVEAASLNYLKEYYNSKNQTTKIFSSSQAHTIPKYNGRADGFLCFHSDKQNYHSVSLEAKSHKTLINLKPYFEIDRFLIHIALFSFAMGILPTVYFSSLKWIWLILIYFLFSLIIFSLLGWILNHAQPLLYKKVDVINQVSRYPANEKWIAISSDSVNLLKIRKSYIKGCSYDNLENICKKQGVGLIVVHQKGIKVILYPKFRKGEFLKCYKFKNDVEKFISLDL